MAPGLIVVIENGSIGANIFVSSKKKKECFYDIDCLCLALNQRAKLAVFRSDYGDRLLETTPVVTLALATLQPTSRRPTSSATMLSSWWPARMTGRLSFGTGNLPTLSRSWSVTTPSSIVFRVRTEFGTGSKEKFNMNIYCFAWILCC